MLIKEKYKKGYRLWMQNEFPDIEEDSLTLMGLPENYNNRNLYDFFDEQGIYI
jgi:hypothetical protein